MVIELNDHEKAKEYIAKNRLVLLASIKSSATLDRKRYVLDILRKIEEESEPTIYAIAVEDVSMTHERDFDVKFYLYLNGECIFSQEGLFYNKENDLTVLKRGIRETLKKRSIQLKFRKRIS